MINEISRVLSRNKLWSCLSENVLLWSSDRAQQGQTMHTEKMFSLQYDLQTCFIPLHSQSIRKSDKLTQIYNKEHAVQVSEIGQPWQVSYIYQPKELNCRDPGDNGELILETEEILEQSDEDKKFWDFMMKLVRDIQQTLYKVHATQQSSLECLSQLERTQQSLISSLHHSDS